MCDSEWRECNELDGSMTECDWCMATFPLATLTNNVAHHGDSRSNVGRLCRRFPPEPHLSHSILLAIRQHCHRVGPSSRRGFQHSIEALVTSCAVSHVLLRFRRVTQHYARGGENISRGGGKFTLSARLAPRACTWLIRFSKMAHSLLHANTNLDKMITSRAKGGATYDERVMLDDN